MLIKCHLFNFYLLNKDISFTRQDIIMKSSTFIYKVLIEGSVSQIIDLGGLSFHFMLQTGNILVNFLYFVFFLNTTKKDIKIMRNFPALECFRYVSKISR